MNINTRWNRWLASGGILACALVLGAESPKISEAPRPKFSPEFFSMAHTNWPSRPCPPDTNMAIIHIEGDKYFFDDRGYNYPERQPKVIQYPVLDYGPEHVPGRIWINTNSYSGRPDKIDRTIRFYKLTLHPEFIPGTTNKTEVTLYNEAILNELISLKGKPVMDPSTWAQPPSSRRTTNWITVTNW